MVLCRVSLRVRVLRSTGAFRMVSPRCCARKWTFAREALRLRPRDAAMQFWGRGPCAMAMSRPLTVSFVRVEFNCGHVVAGQHRALARLWAPPTADRRPRSTSWRPSSRSSSVLVGRLTWRIPTSLHTRFVGVTVLTSMPRLHPSLLPVKRGSAVKLLSRHSTFICKLLPVCIPQRPVVKLVRRGCMCSSLCAVKQGLGAHSTCVPVSQL